MTSLYKVLQKAIPQCNQHQIQAVFYNVDQYIFLCQQCLNFPSDKEFKSNDLSKSIQERKDSIFPLKQIIQNPILLMVRKNSFLSQIIPQNNKFHVQEFMRILTDIDNLIKTKKSSHEYTKQFFTFLKKSINSKIDSIIQKSQQNTAIIHQIQQSSEYLKRINNDYYNQFLETLEATYVNGTTEELSQLLRKYSVQNQNPFRRIEQKVLQITKDISSLSEINWEHCLSIEKNFLDPYIWSQQKLFLIPHQTKLLSKKEESVILPNDFPHLLGFQKQNSNDYFNDSLCESIQNDQNNHQEVYVKCSDDYIEIMSKSNKQENDFDVIDTFECKENSIDMLYELPKKMLMSVSYSCLKFYSYQFNKIHLLSQINSIKGCSEVLIFQDFCVILAENCLYQIRYSSLSKQEEINLQIPDTEVIAQMQYFFRDQKKQQNLILVKTKNRSTEEYRNLKLKLC